MYLNINSKDFVEKIEANQSILHKICNIYTQNDEDKKDLMQEIIMHLWKSYPKFQGKSKFSTWMYRVSINTAITNFRQSKRNPTNDSVNDIDIAIEHDHHYDEDLQHLYNGIRRLKEVDRAIIMLYLEENSYAQIADIIGISEKNVSVKIVRIKKKLEKMLKSEK